MVFLAKMSNGFGVMEYMKSQTPSTKLLQQTHASRKDLKNPLWAQLKANSPGSGFFT
jgi:hypothetical protein